MSENLERLAELTKKLTTLPELVKEETGSTIDYLVEHGACHSIGIVHNDKYAVQQATLPKGSTFPRHIHIDKHEWLVWVCGDITFEVCGAHEPIRLTKLGDYLHIAAGIKHSVIAVDKDTILLATTVPPDEGYPSSGVVVTLEPDDYDTK